MSHQTSSRPRSILFKLRRSPGFPLPSKGYFLFCVLLISGFCSFYVFFLFSDNSFLRALMLSTLAYTSATVLVISVAHQALHGSLLRNQLISRIIGRLLFIPLGLDGELWAERHLKDHHPHPNSKGFDADIDNPLIFRLAPYVQRRWYHRYQHVYAPFVYSVGVVYTITVDDLRAAFRQASKLSPKARSLLYARFIARKVVFVGLWFGLPLYVSGHRSLSETITLFLVASVPAAWLFLPIAAVHLNEYTSFYEREGPRGFADLQSETTIDFAPNNRIVTLMYGGLNCHLAHHLWPRVAACHYPQIYAELKALNPPTQLLPRCVSLVDLLRSHFRFMRIMGSSDSPEYTPCKLEK